MKNLLLFGLFLVLFTSCKDENIITNVTGYDKTLVIIADDEPSSEMIIKVKGAVVSEHPDVNIQYYQAKPFDVSEASFLLELAAENYPDDAYFVVIVDPGLDTDKLVFSSGNRTVIAPDNGVSTRFRKIYSSDVIYKVTNLSIYGDNYDKVVNIPADIFYSKSINFMLSDAPLSEFGNETEEVIELDITDAAYSSGAAVGEVLFVNNFGNCETNIPKSIMDNYTIGDILEISTDEHKFFAVYGNNYSAVKLNENVVVITGKDYLRLAVNFGNMSQRYSLNSGTKITIKKANIKIGILQYNDSDLAQDIIDDIIHSLSENGLKEGDNAEIIIKNAEGDIPLLKSLVQDFVNENIDIIIPVSTPSAQAAVEYTPDHIPVLFTYVTSPEFAGILNKRDKVTGLSDATDINDYLEFVVELLPDINKAGRLYNPNEANSEFFQESFINNAKFYQLEYHTETVTSGDELSTAYPSLIEFNPNAILIAADNTMNLNMNQLANLCIESNLPLIGDSGQNTADGALASISVDYVALANETGNYAASILMGIPPNDLPIRRFGNSVISLNKITANGIGFAFPKSITDKASVIVE